MSRRGQDLAFIGTSVLPLDDFPELESVILVVEVQQVLQPTLSNVFWYAEGAVGH